MEINKKLVLWCGDAPNQRALANKIHQRFGLKAILLDTKVSAKPLAKKKITLARIIDRLRFHAIHSAWKNMLHHYAQQFPSWPSVPVVKLPSINSEEGYKRTAEVSPDLIIVSGTSLIRDPLLQLPSAMGIINLHTGLSPYVKGGPNCTNWCIANNDWHLVGNTIMWINAGIDTGNIIATETLDIRDCESLTAVQIKVMEHAHDLYLRSIDYLLHAPPPHTSVPQKDIDAGRLFLTRMWDGKARARLLRNWKKRKHAKLFSSPKTIALPRS